MRVSFLNVLLGLGMIQSVALTSGCATGTVSDPTEAVSSTGTFSMPLLAQAGGATYRLQGNLYVNGPTFTFIDIDGDTDVVSASLPTGDYYAYLYSHTLSRDDGTGNFVPVESQLVSSNPANFQIFNQTTTTVSFQFETDGQIITVGTGHLNVDVEVSLTPPLCTVLGSDCAAGTWCAPTELTARPLSCISEGPVPEGGACDSPLDCAANTSCFDFGASPVCTKLCLSSEFDQPCGGGGTCTAQGIEYGVCAPMP
jgi:hypothetical protein